MDNKFSKAIVLRRNIERYERLLKSLTDERATAELRVLLEEARNDLARIQRDILSDNRRDPT
jgi:hypothetical protein